MSLEAKREWEASSRSSGATFEVGKELALRAQRHSSLVWATNPELAASCRISVRQVQRALRWLESHGEIVRQPASRRTYRIAPGAPQQSLPGLARGDTAMSPPPAPVGATVCHPPHDTHAGAGSTAVKTFNPTTPPDPPPAGGVQTGSPPSPDRAPRRRVRRRGAEVPAGEPCPAASERLHSAWRPLQARLAEALGEEWAIWGAGAHPHELGADALVLAFEPSTLRAVHRRFGERISQSAGCPVRLVGCARIGGRR